MPAKVCQFGNLADGLHSQSGRGTQDLTAREIRPHPPPALFPHMVSLFRRFILPTNSRLKIFMSAMNKDSSHSVSTN